MLNKKYLIIGAFILIILGGLLSHFIFKEVTVVSEAVSPQQALSIGDQQQANRLATLEKKMDRIGNQFEEFANRTEVTVGEVDDEEQHSEEQEQSQVEEGFYPLSAEAIALQDEIQNNYIDQISNIFVSEELDPEWAQSVESEVLPKLMDSESLASMANATSDSDSVDGSTPDINVSNFTCRSRICETEVISGTMKEMLAYQNLMVNKTKFDLPSAVFSTIEPYGNKFQMKAYLARDEYDFPAPTAP